MSNDAPTGSTTSTDTAMHELFAHGDDHIERLRNIGSPRAFIISGPSGVGKDSVLEQLRKSYPEAYYAVTATSRPKREGEIDGVHYHFIERGEFERQIANGGFIESAMVYENLYGVPKQPIVDGLANGQHVIIKVDVKGAETLRKKISNTVSIFLSPGSMEELFYRLRARKTSKQDDLVRRFRTASEELDRAEEFDYVVFNESDQLDRAVEHICHIIEAEQQRINPPEVSVTSE